MVFLFDLNIINDVLSTFRVNLFAVNHLFTFPIICSAFLIRVFKSLLWQNMPVSSAKILNNPSLQEFARSFIYMMNNSGPSTDP